MPTSPEQQATLQYIWNDLHEKQGETTLAARLAYTQWECVNTKEFTDGSQAEWHGEIARQAEVLSRAAALLHEEKTVATDYLRKAMVVVEKSHPVGKTEEEALGRSVYWEPVYGERNANVICLRDLEKLCATLYGMTGDMSLALRHGQISQLLAEVTNQNTELIGVISRMEHRPYMEALNAYRAYCEMNDQNVGRALTLHTQFLGRSISEGHPIEALRGWVRWATLLIRHPKFASFALREIVKHVPKSLKTRREQRRYQSWKSQNEQEPITSEELHEFLSYTWIATETGKTSHLEDPMS